MPSDDIHPQDKVFGEVRAHRVSDRQLVSTYVPNLLNGKLTKQRLLGCWSPQCDFQPNLVLYEWASIVGELLRNAPNRKLYHIGGMYLEFENNSGAAVSPPTPVRDEGGSYYESLLTHPTRDYLRLPATAVTLTSTNESLFPFGNRVTAFAQSEGVAGVHGKEFSAAQQSRVYGVALAAYPDFSDATQDLLLSRFYYSDTDDQLVKLTGSQIGVEWRLNLL